VKLPVNNNACCRVLGHSSKCSISFRSVPKADCQQLGICGRYTNSITAMYASSAGAERQPARGHTQGNTIHSAKSCPLPTPVPAALPARLCACKVASLLCVTTCCLASTLQPRSPVACFWCDCSKSFVSVAVLLCCVVSCLWTFDLVYWLWTAVFHRCLQRPHPDLHVWCTSWQNQFVVACCCSCCCLPSVYLHLWLHPDQGVHEASWACRLLTTLVAVAVR